MARYLWTQREDIGPSARVGHAMTYDSARSRTLLFGGDSFSGAFLNDTWEWNGEYWTQTSDIGPAPRRDHAMCFDSVRGAALVFGGASGQAPFADTWSNDGQDWTQLEDSGPTARSGHVMAFDSVRGRAVLFGGETAGGLVNDTWEWDGNAWTQQEDTGPSPRKYHAMAFDVVHSKIILFGGDPGNGKSLGDTWSWDGTNWTQIADFGATPCLRSAMVSTDVQIAIFGGLNSSNNSPATTVFHESWVFDGKHWTHRQDIGPGPRWGHAMAFDSARRNIVLFGGLPIFGAIGDAKLQPKLLGDTWEHKETDAAAAPTGQPTGGAFDVEAVILQPTSVPAGGQVTATVVAPPSNVTIQATLVWILKSDFDSPDFVNTGGASLNPANIHPITQVSIPAGQGQISYTFAAPNESGEDIVILAVGASGVTAFAVLTIT